MGRFAVVADPHGARFDLFRGNEAEPPPLPVIGTPGAVGWHELFAGDVGSAWAFYSSLFGWTKDSAMEMGAMGAMGTYPMFAAGGEAIGGMMTKPPEVPAPGWLYYFNVEAIDAALTRVTACGGTVLNRPMEVPSRLWTLQCLDPQGEAFARVAPKR